MELAEAKKVLDEVNRRHGYQVSWALVGPGKHWRWSMADACFYTFEGDYTRDNYDDYDDYDNDDYDEDDEHYDDDF